MKKLLLFVFMMAVCFSQALVAQEKPFVHCLVLDNTKSMIGHPGKGIYVPEENIWNDVQNYCCEWVNGLPESSTVLFFTYAENLKGPQTFVINSNDDKESIKKAIMETVADGQKTYIASSLQKVIDYLTENYPENNKRIYLITDGKDEDKAKVFADVVRGYGSWRGDYDYLYFVDINNQADKEIKKAFKEIEGGGGIVNGLPNCATLRPIFDTIPYVLGETKSFDQSFVLTDGKFSSEMYFEVSAKGVDINPSKIFAEKMKRISESKFSCSFEMTFPGNIEKEGDFVVELKGCNLGNDNLNFAPNTFVVHAGKKVVVKSQVRVKTKKGLED